MILPCYRAKQNIAIKNIHPFIHNNQKYVEAISKAEKLQCWIKREIPQTQLGVFPDDAASPKTILILVPVSLS